MIFKQKRKSTPIHAILPFLVVVVLVPVSVLLAVVIAAFAIIHPQLVDAYAQVSPADMPILRVGIDCTLTQLLDKGFLHAVS